MKPVCICIVLLAAALPVHVLAEPTDTFQSTNGATIHAATYNVATGERTAGRGSGPKSWQYTDTVNSGYYTNSADDDLDFTGDDIQETALSPWWPTQPGLFPSSITELMFGYYAPPAYNPGMTSWTAIVQIRTNTTQGSFMGAALTAITVSGLPLGGWLMTLDLQAQPVPKITPSMWFLVDYTDLTNGGPLVSFNRYGGGPLSGYPGYGYSHDHFYVNGGLFFHSGPYWADFVHSIAGVPEPTTIALVAAAGLLVLRRRNAAASRVSVP
jgi:hypothetical protein